LFTAFSEEKGMRSIMIVSLLGRIGKRGRAKIKRRGERRIEERRGEEKRSFLEERREEKFSRREETVLVK
jgi:hypothetical protein